MSFRKYQIIVGLTEDLKKKDVEIKEINKNYQKIIEDIKKEKNELFELTVQRAKTLQVSRKHGH